MTLTLADIQKKLLEMMQETINGTGIDISKWNEIFDIDTPDLKVILQILDFVVLRMGYGGTDGKPWKDIKFDEFWAELLQHPEIMRMLYWYFSSEVPWEDQLEFVCNMLDDIGDDWEVFWLDLEAINNKKTAGYALTAIRFLKAMQKRYPNKRIGLYANKYFYKDNLRVYTAEVDGWAYWVAQYPWGNWITNVTEYFINWWAMVFSSLTKKPSMPPSRGADDWEIWQVGDRTGFGKFLGLGGRDVDINITRRTWANFILWVGKPSRWGGVTPPEPPTGDCEELQISLNALYETILKEVPALETTTEYLNNAITLVEGSLSALKHSIQD